MSYSDTSLASFALVNDIIVIAEISLVVLQTLLTTSVGLLTELPTTAF